MALLPTGTQANLTEAYFLKANASLINVSTINAKNAFVSSAVVSSLVGESLSTNILDAEYINNSTINTIAVDIDGQILTATPTDLLLNGIPIATASSLSSIQDWSLYPAISTLDMNSNNIITAGNISSTGIQAGNALFGNLVAINAMFISSYTSTISASVFYADTGDFSTLNVSDYVSANVIDCSGLIVNHLISTPELVVSSINGSEFTSTGINIQVAGVSSLVANSISSLGAEVRQALVSTIQFKPQFSLDVNFDFASLGAGIKSGLTNIGVGIGTGLVALASGFVASATSRRGNTTIVQNTYEQYSMPTQIQYSTLGVSTPSVLRLVSSSGQGNTIPGDEYFISTIISPGTLCVRSLGDPVNLADPSTATSSIQAFGQWVAVPGGSAELWAEFPAVSSITFSTGVNPIISIPNTSTGTLTIDAPTYGMPGNLNLGTEVQINGNNTGNNIVEFYRQGAAPSTTWLGAKGMFLTQDGATPVPFYHNTLTNRLAFTDQTTPSPSIVDVANVRDLVSTFSTQALVASTLSAATILGANDNIFGNFLSTPGLVIDAANVFLSTNSVIFPGNFNGSTMSLTQGNIRSVIASSITTSSLTFSQAGAFGLSSIMSLSTANIPGQGTSTTLYANTDLSLGQNDLYAQQIRVGYNSVGGSALSEVIFYAPDGTNRALGLGSQDATIRVQSTANSGLNNGYLLDTFVNKPFFSTINNSTCMMATIPSTTLGVFGVSTLSVIPPINVFGSFYSSTSQQVAGANTITPLTFNSEAVNVGGLTYAGSTINVPIAGTYSITHSVQFDTTSGGTNTAQFWVLKNGAALPQTNSIVSITNNGDTLGTIEVLDTAAANDKYGVAIYSADANMTAQAVAAGATPAVPSVITNIKRLG